MLYFYNCFFSKQLNILKLIITITKALFWYHLSDILILGIIMENIILSIITLGALFYLYKKIFKNNGCNCGKGSCKSNEK